MEDPLGTIEKQINKHTNCSIDELINDTWKEINSNRKCIKEARKELLVLKNKIEDAERNNNQPALKNLLIHKRSHESDIKKAEANIPMLKIRYNALNELPKPKPCTIS